MKNWFDQIRIYHLLIDRFNGGWQVPPKSENVFCGGNLQGVIGKLDYIKNLGFNAIMLSPIFKSANYHGYHTLNFEDVDPHLGTWDDYRQLLDEVAAEARKAGDQEVYRFDLSPIDDEAFYGNDYHPNVYEDEKMAAELTAYLRKLMGWF